MVGIYLLKHEPHNPLPFRRVKCSGGSPTPTGIARRVRPRKNEEAHRKPRGKLTPAAERNDPRCL
ncbi:hypothetical protein VL12_04365 [Rossellomorea marisflavi]|nr:hypothetical protein VL12_04365 [Rossellomorea marisflavi]